MPTTLFIGKDIYESTKSRHAEELMFSNPKYSSGDLEIEMNAWPCTGERGHDCHELFRRKSEGRRITVEITDDHGGYARNHGKAFGSTGTIIYDNGNVEDN